jgi:hypothetical protein
LDPLPEANQRDWFFHLQPGPLLQAWNYWHFAGMIACHVLVTVILIFIPILFPMNRWTLFFFYLPVLGALLAQFLKELTYASDTVINVAYLLFVFTCLRVAYVLPLDFVSTPEGVSYPSAEQLQFRTAWTVTVVVASPILLSVANNLQPVQSLHFSCAFAFLTVVSALCMMPLTIPWLPNRFAFALVPVALIYGRAVVDGYCCRLAASPFVSFHASLALAESRNRGSSLPRPAKMPGGIITSPWWQGTIVTVSVLLFCQINAEAGRSVSLSPLVIALAGVQAILSFAFVSLVLPRVLPPGKTSTPIYKLAIGSFLQALALWETDIHATPYAPGIYRGVHFQAGALPFRRGLTWMLTVLNFFVVLYALGRSEFAAFAVRVLSSSLYNLPYALVAVIVFAQMFLLLALFAAFAPALLQARLVAEGVIEPEVKQ